MISYQLFFVFTLLLASPIVVSTQQRLELAGLGEYQELNNQYSFAYSIASGYEINYRSVLKNQTDFNQMAVVNEFDIDTRNTQTFACPIACFPFAIVYRLASDPVVPLRLNKTILARMVTESSFNWDDPQLKELNPTLPPAPYSVRMILNREVDLVNEVIISYLFPDHLKNVTEVPGSWAGLASPRNSLVGGYKEAIASLGLVTNTIAFLPLPLTTSIADKVRFATIVRGENTVTVDSPFEVEFKRTKDILHASVADSSTSWPLYVFSYISFDQTPTNNKKDVCEQNTFLLRYFYWVFGNQYLSGATTDLGFRFFKNETYQRMREHLLTAECTGDKVLVYTNLSPEHRTTALFGISIALIGIFLGMIIFSWALHPYRRLGIIVLNHSLVILGLFATMASFTIYWFTPTNSAMCLARDWLLGIGYTNVMASLYGKAISVDALHRSRRDLTKSFLSTIRNLLIAYLLLELIECVILIVWSVVNEPTSEEVVVSAINWTTIRTCTDSVGVMKIIEIVYFCCISVYSCYVIYRCWGGKGVEDPRWLLLASFSQLLFLPMILIITELVDLTDDQLYVIKTSLFLFAEGNVVCFYFLPQMIASLKKYFPSNNSKSSEATSAVAATTITMGEFDPKAPTARASFSTPSGLN